MTRYFSCKLVGTQNRGILGVNENIPVDNPNSLSEEEDPVRGYAAEEMSRKYRTYYNLVEMPRELGEKTMYAAIVAAMGRYSK